MRLVEWFSFYVIIRSRKIKSLTEVKAEFGLFPFEKNYFRYFSTAGRILVLFGKKEQNHKSYSKIKGSRISNNAFNFSSFDAYPILMIEVEKNKVFTSQCKHLVSIVIIFDESPLKNSSVLSIQNSKIHSFNYHDKRVIHSFKIHSFNY